MVGGLLSFYESCNTSTTKHLILKCNTTLSRTSFLSDDTSEVAFTLKGTKRQHSGQMSQIFKSVKIIDIQPVRPTEVCGKV